MDCSVETGSRLCMAMSSPFSLPSFPFTCPLVKERQTPGNHAKPLQVQIPQGVDEKCFCCDLGKPTLFKALVYLCFNWHMRFCLHHNVQKQSLALDILWSSSSFSFDLPGALDTSSNTSETSIMSFLSAMESRSLQAGPVSASLLPPFRPPSWPAGENTSIP